MICIIEEVIKMFNEEQLEDATLNIFEELGYERLNGYNIDRDYHNVFMENNIFDDLCRINKEFNDSQIQDAIKTIKTLSHGNPIEDNKTFTRYLLEGVPVQVKTNNGYQYKNVKLIDFNNINANHFQAINQYTIIEFDTKRPDIIVFINGIPLVVIELKTATNEDVKLEDAYTQLTGYRNVYIPSLFKYNQILVISDGVTAKAGTITSPYSRFSDWKKVEAYDEVYENMPTHETLFYGMFKKERLLDIIQNFILFSDDKKILAQYHQYFGVKKAIVSTVTNGAKTGKAGIVWHTQGSGKSFSMVFYSGNMIKLLNNPTIVVVTDRNDLDNQLYETFVKCDYYLKQHPQKAESRQSLDEMLKDRISGGIFFTTLQKFEEVTEETQVEKNLPIMELPIWFDGKQINEILLYQTILQQHEIKCINGILYDIDRSIPNDEMEKEILDIIEHYWTSGISAKVTAVLSGFKMYTRSDPLPIKEDRVHFKNGTYFVNQKFINQKEWTQNRLTVNYNKDAPKPEKWLAFLDGLLEADDIVCLQEFMGYCLIPSNRGQKMLLIIGKGGEGKSRIGRILKRIFGHNMNSGSLQKLETDKFARADQEGKLLYLDDDMKTEALPSTNVIKAIVTSEDEMDLEKKGKQSYQGLLVCRILAFGNGTLKSLFDRSRGFYRRQIILETKDVPPDRINDPYLADKMMEEVEGIVLWCIEGLERLIRNDYQFTISNKSQLLMDEIQEDDDNILSFLESTGYIGLEKGTYATSKDLYVAYCRWCNDNLDVPVSERSFARRFKERSADYGMTYDKNISVGNGRHCRGFRGVHVKVRTKDVNY